MKTVKETVNRIVFCQGILQSIILLCLVAAVGHWVYTSVFVELMDTITTLICMK